MKTNIARKAIQAALLAAALLAGGLFSGGVSAQAGFQGKFTLSHETRWGQAVLPPGDYAVTFDNHDASILVIRDAKSRRTVAYESVNVREDASEGESALVIGVRRNQRVVNSLRIAELGETFVYQRPPAHSREAEEARQTETVPVLLAQK